MEITLSLDLATNAVFKKLLKSNKPPRLSFYATTLPRHQDKKTQIRNVYSTGGREDIETSLSSKLKSTNLLTNTNFPILQK